MVALVLHCRGRAMPADNTPKPIASRTHGHAQILPFLVHQKYNKTHCDLAQELIK
jgi:hypothetical protein